MSYPVLQKLDSLTPWHVLRLYPTQQEATWAAIQFAREREPQDPKIAFPYPQYMTNGRIY